MPVHLTDTAIAKAAREVTAAKKRRDLADTACPGLRLRLTPAGGKTWVLACRDLLGRMRRYPLANYPTVSIATAREKARATHHAVKYEAADPIGDRRRRRAMGEAAKAGEGTLNALLDLYGEKVGARLKYWSAGRKRVENVFRGLLPRPLPTITLADLQLATDGYPSVSTASVAARTLRPVLRWAAAPGRSYVPAELGSLRAPAAGKPRQRILSRDELAAVLPELRRSNPYGRAMRLMLLTLARREEVAAARWGAIDLETGTWTIAETKNGRSHTIPLSRQALDLLRSLRPEKVKPDTLVFGTITGRRLTNWDRARKAIHEATSTTGWHRHDLRRSGATMMGELGVLPAIIESALNHSVVHTQIAAVYNQSRYRPLVSAALQQLADLLDGIERGGAQIMPLRTARSSG